MKDDIPDDVQLWVQPVGAVGRMTDMPDPLAAQNTWKNTLYADVEHELGERSLRLKHRFKWDLVSQRDSRQLLDARQARKWSGFVGLVDKAEWTIPLGLGVLEPRWKSELRFDRPYLSRRETARSVEEILSLLWTQPLMAEKSKVAFFSRYGRQIFDTQLQSGLELSKLWDGGRGAVGDRSGCAQLDGGDTADQPGGVSGISHRDADRDAVDASPLRRRHKAARESHVLLGECGVETMRSPGRSAARRFLLCLAMVAGAWTVAEGQVQTFTSWRCSASVGEGVAMARIRNF